MLNWELMRHPMNWITIILMTIIGMMLIDIALQPFAKANGETGNNNH
jgi:hypothetical protein